MNIKMNPMLNFNRIDMRAVSRTRVICDRLMEALAHYTMTEDACIVCADNGEVLITEREIFEMLDVLNRMERIMEEAPQNYDDTVDDKKMLAISFVG